MRVYVIKYNDGVTGKKEVMFERSEAKAKSMRSQLSKNGHIDIAVELWNFKPDKQSVINKFCEVACYMKEKN